MDYRQAGVDLHGAAEAQRRIAERARTTFNPSVLSSIGTFGALFQPDFSSYREPVLVASTDGVGTKIHVAVAAGRHDTVGYDLVSHCINDILVQGATPLFFMDYVAVGRLDPGTVDAVVEGVARACREFGCPLIGGETAEMPGTYAPGDYDLAGFIVGVVERDRVLTGSRVREGDLLLALPSSGLHTNGYSLARKVLLEAMGRDVHSVLPTGETVAEALLAPHRCYLPALGPLLDAGRLRAMAHVTGGGIPGNLPRVLPAGLGACVRREAWTPPELFLLIQREGRIDEEEMFATFNMGVGMILVVAPEELGNVQRNLESRSEGSTLIGSVVAGAGVSFV